MEIKLTHEESENIFYTSLCDAVGTGYMNGYGIELMCDRSQYKDSKEHLLRVMEEKELMNTSVCYEDVLMQVLRDGGTLTFVDHEGDGYMTRTISLKEVHERVEKTPLTCLTNIIKMNSDSSDADAVLQTVFFEEIIFG
jgi:hypothetical protein